MADFKVHQEYDLIEEDMKKWPVYLQARDRGDFIHELNRKIYNDVLSIPKIGLEEIINKCVQSELRRVKTMPWKVDPPNERLFWQKAQKDLAVASKYNSGLGEERLKELLRRIINRYSQEIVGDFKISTFNFARKFTHSFFSIIHNKAFKNYLPTNYFSKKKLQENIRLYGYVEEVRKMYENGHIIAVIPTHISNIDSPLIGYILEFRAGLPAFNYGAGLNLFNSEIAAFFMNRLGAYRIDRRKKNRIYLESLTAYSELAVSKGVNTLFFTGGTRSRSGKVEEDLKLGLLSTLLDAQRELIREGSDRKIIVVPMTLSYHFVFEAEKLITDYLRITGKERFIRTKKPTMSFFDYFKLFGKLLTKETETLSAFAEPVDVFGNRVDISGNSYDQHNNKLELRDYFLTNGEIVKDAQRESVYTTSLSDKLVESYHKYNIVLSSHALAYMVFEYWFKNSKIDLFTFLRTPLNELYMPEELLSSKFEKFVILLKKQESKGKFILSEIFNEDVNEIINHALKNLGVFNKYKSLLWHKKKNGIISEDLKLLYFYHNRLEGFGLENHEEEWI